MPQKCPCPQTFPMFMRVFKITMIMNEFLHKTPVPLLVTRHGIMTTSSAGGLLCGYKPMVLAGSKEPLKIFYILFNFLCILTYCINIISSAPEMSIAILILQICMSILCVINCCYPFGYLLIVLNLVGEP